MHFVVWATCQYFSFRLQLLYELADATCWSTPALKFEVWITIRKSRNTFSSFSRSKKPTLPSREGDGPRGGGWAGCLALTDTTSWCGPPPWSTAAGWWRARCSSCTSARRSPRAAAWAETHTGVKVRRRTTRRPLKAWPQTQELRKIILIMHNRNTYYLHTDFTSKAISVHFTIHLPVFIAGVGKLWQTAKFYL